MPKLLPLVTCAVVLASGCSHREGLKIATPDVVSSIATWRTEVKKEMDATGKANLADVQKRSFFIGYTTALIMSQYASFRTSLMSGRAISSIAFDVLDLGLTTTIPIVNGARGKTILGSLATGFKGTQLSIDRNLFNQQTTSAILTAMDTCVLRQRKVLDGKRQLPYESYSEYDAYSDLVVLYGCTTLAGAMEELVETQAAAARAERPTMVNITPEQLDQLKQLKTAFEASINSDKKAALALLNAMGVENVSEKSSVAELQAAYGTLALRVLDDKNPQITKLMEEAKKAGLLK